MELNMNRNKYEGKAIRWIEKFDHYELVFTDDFITPSSTGIGKLGMMPFPPMFGNSLLTDVILDMREGDKNKEVHVFVGSFGGEVAALNMILQQLLTYEYRVGINLGTACSCGWMLLFACQERYVSPFSQAMYHDISCVTGGKHTELQYNAEFMGRWQKELLKITDTAKILTPREMELGRTSEVWLTGRELIERGAAKDFSEYQDRRIPHPAPYFVEVRGTVYGRTPNGWVKAEMAKEKPLTYAELVVKANQPPELPKGLKKLMAQKAKKEGKAEKKAKPEQKPETAGGKGEKKKEDRKPKKK